MTMRQVVLLAVLITIINAYYDDSSSYSSSNAHDNMISVISNPHPNNSFSDVLRSLKRLQFDLIEGNDLSGKRLQTKKNAKARKNSKAKKNSKTKNILRAKKKPNSKMNLKKKKNMFGFKPKLVPIATLKKILNQRGSIKNAMILKKKLSWPRPSPWGKMDFANRAAGDVVDFECNRCVYVTPMLYVCSSKLCTQTISKLECVDGTKVESKDCNSCLCIGGEVMCTLMACPIEKNNKALILLKKVVKKMYGGVQCKDGEPISVDSCNMCACVGGRKIYCTKKACPPKKDAMDYVKIQVPYKLDFCQNGSWYSPSDDSCKHCYCVNSDVSFCFVGICPQENKKLSGPSNKIRINSPYTIFTPNLSEHCKEGTSYSIGTKTSCYECVCNRTMWNCSTKKNRCPDNVKFTPQLSEHCEEGSSYSIGTKTSCHECVYNRNMWDCSTKKTLCSDYDNGKCQEKSVFANTQGPCSVCYSDLSGNVCATDLKCAKTFYENAPSVGRCITKMDCYDRCTAKKRLHGTCYKGCCKCF